MIDINLGGALVDAGDVAAAISSDAKGVGIHTSDKRLVYVLGLSKMEVSLLARRYSAPVMLRIWSTGNQVEETRQCLLWQLHAYTRAQRAVFFAELRSTFCIECGSDALPCHCSNDE